MYENLKETFKHLLQSLACSLLYTTLHDPEQQLHVIDDARHGSSVAADNKFSSNNEGVSVFDAVSSQKAGRVCS
jgi:hypothetical protein